MVWKISYLFRGLVREASDFNSTSSKTFFLQFLKPESEFCNQKPLEKLLSSEKLFNDFRPKHHFLIATQLINFFHSVHPCLLLDCEKESSERVRKRNAYRT
jgi:hypothetical protein